MEALRCLLDEIELSRRRGDIADWKHGMGVLKENIVALSQEPDLLLRADRALNGLREMRAAHERHGQWPLAAEAAATIATLEDPMAKLAQAAKRELDRRDGQQR